MGICAGPEDLYLGLRGLRTLRLRLEQSAQNGLAVMHFLSTHPLIPQILHPAHQKSPDNMLYNRDFSGSCGLFGFVLDNTIPQSKLDNAIDTMSIFRIGDSWGGYESLIKQAHLTDTMRKHKPELAEGHLIRVYNGLEHPEDLIADLSEMLGKLT